MAIWRVKKVSENTDLVVQKFKVSETLAQVIINRKIYTEENINKYLNPSLSQLNDTFLMKDLQKGLSILLDSIERKEKISIYGDYDVDGVMSTCILYKGIKSFYEEVNYYIPNREEEGYGLNKNAIKKLREAEVDLLITCDNGIASLAEVDYAKEIGLKIIIIDHHEPFFAIDENQVKIPVLPKADAIIDPKQDDCNYPFKMLCAGGIAFKFIKALFEYKKKEFVIMEELITLAMIATFCDIVDLLDENRVIAKKGLEILNKNKKINMGLEALMKEKNILDKNIDNFSIGFLIGPCINATGRLEEAILSVRLFTTEDEQEAKELATKLSDLNERRKYLTNKSVENALLNLKDSEVSKDKVIIMYDEEMHESIAGIVAGRVKDRFYHPTIMLTKGENYVKGSARSIESYNIFEEMFKCKHLFERFGGHAMAAGLSIKEENIGEFRKLINENCQLKEEDFDEIIKIDKAICLEDVTFKLASQIQLLEPFGKENKEPIFGTKNLKPKQIRVIEDKNTIIFTFETKESYREIKAICFGKVDVFKERLCEVYNAYDSNKILSGVLRNLNFYIDIVYSIDINEYNGKVSVQIRIKDFRINNI
jgi:single-stranded-DNA-specific exonuclease